MTDQKNQKVEKKTADELAKMSFAARVKYAYHTLGLKGNEEVYNFLKENGLGGDDEASQKKIQTRVSSQMWAIRTPEDAKNQPRSSRRGGTQSPRVVRLRQLLMEGKGNMPAWEAMHKDVADAEASKQEAPFEAPSKKWVIDTAWRLRKEPEVAEAIKKHEEAAASATVAKPEVEGQKEKTA